jgi:AcrR family transcriptional regulator
MSRLTKQMRTTKSRTYRMTRRAEHVDGTRRRITEAAVRLHTTVGPANTSIAAIAEEAGVTRLTVYRHFADMDEIFVACMAHWAALHPRPDPAAWAAIPDLRGRAERAFGELFAWYRDNGDDLYPINRDAAAVPASAQASAAATTRALADGLLAGLVPDGPAATARDRATRAVARHLVLFWTWRTLVQQPGLDDAEAVDLAVRMLLAAGADA